MKKPKGSNGNSGANPGHGTGSGPGTGAGANIPRPHSAVAAYSKAPEAKHAGPRARVDPRAASPADVPGARALHMPYIVAIIWILLALAAGYWVGKYGFAFPPGTFASSGTASASDAAKDEADIRAFIQRYFSTWSAKDIAGYGACFQENATIAFVDQISDEPVVLDLKNFLESQRKAHETADVPMTETSESVSVQLHGRVAHVQVRWVLKKDGSDVRGWDFYTLVKAGQNWKIMHLSFFNDE